MLKDYDATVTITALFCDTCGEEMAPTGDVFTSYPAQYPHTCPNGHEETHMARYPKMSFTRGKERVE